CVSREVRQRQPHGNEGPVRSVPSDGPRTITICPSQGGPCMTLSDKQRRTLVRGLFIALIVVPCIATAAVAFYLKSDMYRSYWERSLSESLAMRVTIDAVRQLRWDAVLFEGVRCYDPENDALMLECRNVEAEQFSDGRNLQLHHPTIFADH